MPTSELRRSAFDAFVAESGPFRNPAHQHLAQAHMGFLWTAVVYSR